MVKVKQSKKGKGRRKNAACSAPITAPVIDLRQVDPHGRLDVMAASLIDRLANKNMPELVPVIDSKREVIHAFLNERLGPHAIGFDIPNAIDVVKPFLPLAGMMLGEFLKSRAVAAQSAPINDGGKAA